MAEAMADLNAALKLVQAVAVDGLQDIGMSVEAVHTCTGSNGIFNNVVGNAQSTRLCIDGTAESASTPITHAGGRRQRFLLALSSCNQLLGTCTNNQDAETRLPNAGADGLAGCVAELNSCGMAGCGSSVRVCRAHPG